MKSIKYSLLVVCVILLAFLISITIFSKANAAEKLEIIFDNTQSKIGDTAIVPVKIKNNPGIASFRFRVSYDASNLEFISADAGEILTDGSLTSTNNEAGTVTFQWFSTNNAKGDGNIAYLKFKVLESARDSYPLTISYLENDIVNESFEAIPFFVTQGSISVGCSLFGSITSIELDNEMLTVRLLKNDVLIDSLITYDGSYSFNLLSPGTYLIEVSKKNHTTRTEEVIIGFDDINLNLKLNLIGDINGDGRINTIDVNIAFSHTQGNKALSGYEFDCANVINTDNEINSLDVDRIFEHVKKTNLLWQ